MRGHITQRSKGVDAVRIELPTVNGKRQREMFTVYGSLKEAEAKMATRIGQIEKGKAASRSGKITVADLMELWMKSNRALAKREEKRSLASVERYQQLVDQFIVPALGSIIVTKLTALEIDDAVNTWAATPRGKPS